PQVTSAEEPDGGNLLVRIWRGAGVGNLPAYSTTVFCYRCRADNAAHTACFLLLPNQTFCFYTVHMCSIVDDKSWHCHPYPLGRGGSYGASGGHLRTSGSQRHGALPRDRGAPGDLSRLARR